MKIYYEPRSNSLPFSGSQLFPLTPSKCLIRKQELRESFRESANDEGNIQSLFIVHFL